MYWLHEENKYTLFTKASKVYWMFVWQSWVKSSDLTCCAIWKRRTRVDGWSLMLLPETVWAAWKQVPDWTESFSYSDEPLVPWRSFAVWCFFFVCTNQSHSPWHMCNKKAQFVNANHILDIFSGRKWVNVLKCRKYLLVIRQNLSYFLLTDVTDITVEAFKRIEAMVNKISKFLKTISVVFIWWVVV